MGNRRLIKAYGRICMSAVMLMFMYAGMAGSFNKAYAAEQAVSGVITDKRVVGVHELSHTSNEVEFGWDKVAGADGYEVWMLDKVTNGYDMLCDTTDNKYKMDNIAQGTKLNFLVRPYTGEKEDRQFGMYSDMFAVGTTPDNVTGLQVTTTGSALIVLEWKAVSDDASYIVYRCAEGQNQFVQVANVSAPGYRDVNVKPSTGYTYKVVACIEGTNARSVGEASVITATSPESVYINQYKGGSECVRLRWDKVSAADGYIIYMKNEQGVYTEIVRINDLNVVEYIQRNLNSGVTYHFMIKPYKIYNGVEYTADVSNEVDVKALVMKPTSVKAAVYKKLAKFKKSKLIKKFTDFAKVLNYKKTYVTPGIINTNVNGFASSGMIIQAVTFVDKYMLVTAYDYEGEENSVVYVLKASNGKYITTILLPNAYHVGGIAYDGYNVWVSAGTSVSCFTYDDVKAAVASGEDFYSVQYRATCPVLTQASFVSYYKNCLWIGEHKETASTTMYGYKIAGKKKAAVSLKKTYSMKIPSRTQDVLFLKNGTMIASCSNQISNASKYYVSCLRKYIPEFGKKKKGKIKTGKSTGKLTMPPMLEGIAKKGNTLYASFESASIKGCAYKMDRICALNYPKIKWK